MNHVKDILAKRYGTLIVIGRHGSDERGLITWKCLCDCGLSIVATGAYLRSGRMRSCGCRKGIKHGHARRNGKTPEYHIWRAMIGRCTNPSNKDYRHYGARGILVCARWRDNFENFFSDMGVRPSKSHSIDRINNDGAYEPSNCRWATQIEQVNNSRHNRKLIIGGKPFSIREVAEMVGLSYTWVAEQTRSGVSVERLLERRR